MSSPMRAARQLLKDWRAAGLTHIPKVELPPAPVATALRTHSPPESSTGERMQPPLQRTVVEPPASTQAPPSQDHAATRQPIQDDMARRKPKIKPGPTLSRDERASQLEKLAKCVAGCVRCPKLAETRTQTVFGVGNPEARVMFLGEAPGADEDRLGEPFVGRAGQLLTKIIQACGWTREEIYICNILRCRPPGNRTPNEEEAANCREWLDGQIDTVAPEYIVCWGACAAQNLLGVKDPIGRLRGRFFSHGEAKVLCTYHPSYLLRNPAAKKPVWEDMKLLLGEMGLPVPE